MSEAMALAAETTPTGRRRSNKRSDGSDQAPVVPIAAAAKAPTPGAQNAALQEPPPKPSEGVDRLHPCAEHLQIVDAEAGLIGPQPGRVARKKFAVCGFASSTRPYILEIAKDPAWRIYGLNQLYRHIPRADAWADIHYNWNEEVVPGTDHYAWIRDCGIPVYMMHRHPQLPTSVRYPLPAILRELRADYFTSTVAYLVALAIWEIDREVRATMKAYVRRTSKAKLAGEDLTDVLRSFYAEYTLGLFGIDLTVGSEYFCEKPCCEFWLGRAVDRDIQVITPPESALCKQQYRYGYERAPGSLIRVKELADHKAQLEAERLEQLKKLCMLEGAIECDGRWQQVAELRERGTKVE